jgi:predicted dehydrogenase
MPITTRRNFVKTAALGAASFSAASWARAAGANERVRHAVIGCGGQGRAHVAGFDALDNVDVAYICDIDATRQAEAVTKARNAKPVGDLRRILDDPSIDSVSIATPDHWHAPAALLAMDAGKHVYIEKPCCHNFREGQMLVAAAQRTSRKVQHGTQSRSNNGIRAAVEMLRGGVIGDVLIAKAWNVQRRNNIGKAQPSDPPAGVDYDMWVGPAEMMPYQENRFHYNWHWWYNFGTGDTGNDGVHEMDYARWGLGVETMPTRAVAFGGKYYHDDQQQYPDTQTAVFEYPGEGGVGQRRQLIFEMRIWATNYPYNVDGGVEFLGTKGKMLLSKRGKVELLGERNQRIDQPLPEFDGDALSDHFGNFVAAIRGDGSLAADIEVAHRSTTLVHLANLSTRLGRSLELDPDTQNIVGDEEANQRLGRAYRDGGHWATPASA